MTSANAWAAGVRPLSAAFLTSGSSMLTLGFERPEGVGHGVLAFIEAALGFGLIINVYRVRKADMTEKLKRLRG